MGDHDALAAVRPVSADDIWAVGSTETGTAQRTLILHWNGRKWSHVPSPHPGKASYLVSVAATSASNAWAVGVSFNGSVDRTLILHWNGRAWARMASPNPAATRDDDLSAVGASSARNAWAVGDFDGGSVVKTLVLHWNGRRWAKAASPSGAASDDFLNGVYVTSASDAWAVGIRTAGLRRTGLLLHWNGRKWQHVAAPRVGDLDSLYAVGASSATNVWAVGEYVDIDGHDLTLADHLPAD